MAHDRHEGVGATQGRAIMPMAKAEILDAEWLALCQLLPEGSSLRDAANSMRLDGCSVVPFIEMYIEALRHLIAVERAAPATVEVCPNDGTVAHFICDKCGDEWYTPNASMAHSNQR